jgi:two-component system, NarL family, nitrate/nitrite response regulator NarL
VSVAVASRHAVTIRGLRRALEGRGLTVGAEARDAAGAVAACARARPDVCILDVELPGGGLVAATALLLQPDAPAVLMLAPSTDSFTFFAALRAGVAGYLLEDVSGERLAEEVRAVAAGEIALGRPFVARLVQEYRADRRRATTELTARELDVLLHLAEGLTTKEIALEMAIRPPTVRRHVATAMRKLGVKDRQAALAALRRVQRVRERE